MYLKKKKKIIHVMSLTKNKNEQSTEGVNVSDGAEKNVCREASLSERITSTR